MLVIVLTAAHDVGYVVGFVVALLILPILAMLIAAAVLKVRRGKALRYSQALRQRITLVTGAVVLLLELIWRFRPGQ